MIETSCLHRTVGSDDFVAVAVPHIHLLLVVNLADFAQLHDILHSPIHFEAADTSCVPLSGMNK